MGLQADSIQGYRSMASHTRQKESYRGGWVKLTPEEVKWYSAEGKRTIKEKVDKIIERYMKPSVVRDRGRKAGFGDVQDLYTKWHGDNLILIAKRRGGRGPGGYSEDFETSNKSAPTRVSRPDFVSKSSEYPPGPRPPRRLAIRIRLSPCHLV